MDAFEFARIVGSWFVGHIGGLHEMLDGGVLHIAPGLFVLSLVGGMGVGIAEEFNNRNK